MNGAAVGYCRVSTEEQEREGISLSNQASRIRSYHHSREISWPLEVVQEQGSAKDMNRKILREIIFGIKELRIRCLIVYKLDRITRNLQDMDTLISLFDQHDVQFLSVQENIDTKTATGRTFIRLVILFAQWERETTAERTSDTMAGKWKDNQDEFILFSRPPYGYEAIKKKVKDSLKVVGLRPDPKSAPIVQQMFEMVLHDHQSFSQIASQFNLYRVAVKRILTNRTYLGEVTFKGQTRKNNHPALVNEETFERVQRILQSRQ